MSATIDTRALERVIGQMVKATAPAGIQQDLVRMLHGEAAPAEARIQGAAFTRVQRRAARSVHARRLSAGVEVEGGTAGGLAATLFPGGEFGGRKSRRVVVQGSVFGRPAQSVRKRTTMMFLPHLGTEGYFFFPTLRPWLAEVRKKSEETVERSLT